MHLDTSAIRPDGGLLFIEGKKGDPLTYPILIAEVKNQGTNDLRAQEGLPKQAKGNAIERLGKNVIGLRTALLRESIFPFVCFGYGCDFAYWSGALTST
jgi:type II restriction enzyme